MTSVILRPAGGSDAPGMNSGPDRPLDARLLSRLRTEHQRILRRASRLDRVLRGAGRLQSLELRALRTFAAVLSGPFATHIALEERSAFPRLANAFPELAGTLARLCEEHAELRALTEDLTAQLERDSSPDRDERLFVIGTDLTELLRLHIHSEERAAYDWIGHLLPVARPAPRAARRQERPRHRGSH